MCLRSSYPILYSKLLYKICKYILDRQYLEMDKNSKKIVRKMIKDGKCQKLSEGGDESLKGKFTKYFFLFEILICIWSPKFRFMTTSMRTDSGLGNIFFYLYF